MYKSESLFSALYISERRSEEWENIFSEVNTVLVQFSASQISLSLKYTQ